MTAESQGALMVELVASGKIKEQIHLFKNQNNEQLRYQLSKGLEWLISEDRTNDVEALLTYLRENHKGTHLKALKMLYRTEEYN